MTSIAQLLIEKSSREASPDYNMENGSMALSPRQSSAYRHNNVHDRQRQDLSPTPPPAPGHSIRYRDRSPGQESTGSQRHGDTRRVPGQLAERARMLPIHGKMESSSPSPSQHAGRHEDLAQEGKHVDNGISRKDEQSIPESSQTTTAGAESWPEDQGEASLGSLETKGSFLTSAAQVKRKPKAELDKRSAKAKVDEAEVPVEGAKVKGKRGRKPKVKENPLESPAPSGATPTSASLTKARAVPQTGIKRQRAMDTSTEAGKPQGANGSEQFVAGPGGYGSDSDLDDFSQHKDMMTYRLEVHKRSQKVQKAYEAQSLVRVHGNGVFF